MSCVVILTALSVEYSAVRDHLSNLEEVIHPQGTIYERGQFEADGDQWDVGIAEIGAGNVGAATEAERAIAFFNPELLFFVGVAGGIKDVATGDVVVATKVFGYEAGKVSEKQFLARPTLGQSAYALLQRSKAEARKGEWLKRLVNVPSPPPRVFVAPIAAGEKVVASKKVEIFEFLRSSYNDAIALEMEGFGFLSAAFAYPNIKAIVIRGISDLIDGKNDDSVEPEQIRQEKASHHASAFAFEVMAKLLVATPKQQASQKLQTLGYDDEPSLIEKSLNSRETVTRKSVLATRKTRIFISYSIDTEFDKSVASGLSKAFAQKHKVFLEQGDLSGTHWAEQVTEAILQSDIFIVLLSEQSTHSESVERQIRFVHHLVQKAGCPAILPIRLNYGELLRYPLSEYLNSLNWSFGQSMEDIPRLQREINQVLVGGNLPLSEIQARNALLLSHSQEAIPQPHYSAQPLPLEMPEGTMEIESRFYVERPSDAVALSTIQRQGVTITIKGPRQMGKSSLLIRLMDTALDAGKRVTFLDFQLFDKVALMDTDQFFHQFCSWLSDELELDNRMDEYWSQSQSNSLCCTRYMQRYILKQLDSPLVLAMDEVESVFDTPFRSDFFSMLRSWHNNRAIPSTRIWKKLDLALVTSTEPYQLIENLNQSPFNVGQVIELADFSPQEITDLNHRHGQPLNSPQEQQLMTLVGGQPYLVRRALYLVKSQQITVDDLFAKAAGDRGPFGDHLRYHLFRLHNQKDLVRGFLQVLRNNSCQDEDIFFRLRGAGLVRREGQTVLPRCQLYADYFQEHLYG